MSTRCLRPEDSASVETASTKLSKPVFVDLYTYTLSVCLCECNNRASLLNSWWVSTEPRPLDLSFSLYLCLCTSAFPSFLHGLYQVDSGRLYEESVNNEHTNHKRMRY